MMSIKNQRQKFQLLRLFFSRHNVLNLGIITIIGFVVGFPDWDARHAFLRKLRYPAIIELSEILSLIKNMAFYIVLFHLVWFWLAKIHSQRKGDFLCSLRAVSARMLPGLFLIIYGLQFFLRLNSDFWLFLWMIIIGIIAANLWILMRGRERIKERSGLWVVIGVAAGYSIITAVLSILKHWNFGTGLHDLGLYDQMLWGILNGKPFHCTLWQIEGMYNLKQFDYNFLAEHFMIILYLIAPIYALFQSSETLLILQSAALGASGVLLFFIVHREFKSPLLGVAFALSFLLNPLVSQTNLKDFHADAFEPFFLFLGFLFLQRKNLTGYFISLLLALSCKEDVSLSVMVLGFYLLIFERRRMLGAATMALGFGWAALIIGYIIPQIFRGGEPLRHYYRYRHLMITPSGSMLEVAFTLLFNPVYWIRTLITEARMLSLFKLFVPVIFLPFLSFGAILFLPTVASNLLSNWNIQYQLQLHYGIAILPFVYIAAILGLKRHLKLRCDERRINQSWIAIVLLVVAILSSYYYGRLPYSKNFKDEKFVSSQRQKAGYEAMKLIPRNAALSAQSGIGTHLTHREKIYVFPEIQDAEWVLLDTQARSFWPVSEEQYVNEVKALLTSELWSATHFKDGFLILRKGVPDTINEAVLKTL